MQTKAMELLDIKGFVGKNFVDLAGHLRKHFQTALVDASLSELLECSPLAAGSNTDDLPQPVLNTPRGRSLGKQKVLGQIYDGYTRAQSTLRRGQKCSARFSQLNLCKLRTVFGFLCGSTRRPKGARRTVKVFDFMSKNAAGPPIP